MQTALPPVRITRAEGSWLFTDDGKKILDAISSWWVNVHGHANPHIAKAIADQAGTLEQVIFANFTHPQAERLASRIVQKLPDSLNKVFFSDDGSTAVEVALKMAWQYWHNQGKTRSKILAIEGAYHGDTFGAMSVSGRSVFTKAFDPLLFGVDFLPFPSGDNLKDILEKIRKANNDQVAALIIEPLVQGAGGMRMFSASQLDAIVACCREEKILVIFDEVMTGFGRTGKLFAMDHCLLKPDIVCFSKGLTGGFLPLSLTICTDLIYQAFLSEDKTKTLFHGHSYTANPIACAAANASLDIFEQEVTFENINAISALNLDFAKRLKNRDCVENIRSCGTIFAFDLISGGALGYLNEGGEQLAAQMLDRGYLIRPLGNVVYLMPPYITSVSEMEMLFSELEKLLPC